MNWDYIQNNSDAILNEGIKELRLCSFQNPIEIHHKNFGNYLISHDNIPYYIGEAKDVSKRIKQQFRLNTSTFYKNYLKYTERNKNTSPINISDFRVQHLPCVIGRKEIEEFGIVNLPTIINKFQLGKRSIIKAERFKDIWKDIQKNKTNLLSEGEARILEQPFGKWFGYTDVPKSAGLYIVQEKKKIIYIGESSNINERHITHSKSTYFSALRRHIATEILLFELKEKSGKKKSLNGNEELAINDFLKNCNVAFYPVNFARYELEEYLIKKYKPLLNRKDNKI